MIVNEIILMQQIIKLLSFLMMSSGSILSANISRKSLTQNYYINAFVVIWAKEKKPIKSWWSKKSWASPAHLESSSEDDFFKIYHFYEISKSGKFAWNSIDIIDFQSMHYMYTYVSYLRPQFLCMGYGPSIVSNKKAFFIRIDLKPSEM